MYHSSQFCPKQPSTVACGLGNYNSRANVPSRPADLCLCGPRPFTTFPGLWTPRAMGYYLLLAPPQAQSRRIVHLLNRGLGPGRQVWRPMVCPEPLRLKNPAWSVSFLRVSRHLPQFYSSSCCSINLENIPPRYKEKKRSHHREIRAT